MYIFRKIEPKLKSLVAAGDSVLLLGPRQTGKSTLLTTLLPDLNLSFLEPRTRLRYEKDPQLLADEVLSLADAPKFKLKRPLIIIDEIQKIPSIMDVVQFMIDQKKAQFVLTGSSARKLRRGSQINLLPGRLIQLKLDPLSVAELPEKVDLNELLLYGSLPGIYTAQPDSKKDDLLDTYVATYLEEEIREEAIVRNVGLFSKFLTLFADNAGQLVNFTKLSQQIGVSTNTIRAYFDILEDCLVAFAIPPFTKSLGRRKLVRSHKYLMFDLGIRRLCTTEGTQLSSDRLGHLFEQFIGLELIRLSRHLKTRSKLYFWRDHGGAEVDWVLEHNNQLIPIEVKLSERPDKHHIRHLSTFINGYSRSTQGLVVCQTPRPFKLNDSISAINWRDLPMHLEALDTPPQNAS